MPGMTMVTMACSEGTKTFVILKNTAIMYKTSLPCQAQSPHTPSLAC